MNGRRKIVVKFTGPQFDALIDAIAVRMAEDEDDAEWGRMSASQAAQRNTLDRARILLVEAAQKVGIL